jgi:hypothetical protein
VQLLFFALLVLAVVAALKVASARNKKLVQQAQSWPSTEATIQSGAVERLPHPRSRDNLGLPCFAFSYAVNGKYYSGRFALLEHGDRAADLVKAMVDRKLTIHYDPQHPETYLIPDVTIEGCQVEQKLSEAPFGTSPED